jgi:hypothetical protein
VEMETLQDRPFTLYAGGRPILSFGAKNLTEAQQLAHEEWLRADLLRYRSNTRPLWDGKGRISVRISTSEEKAAFLAAQRAVGLDQDELLLAYLVELDNA